eukprot:GHVU01085179.1.p1 GENE.GHVU01085179.1~~GHVU01085179.1.p1  ORF type:complete len:1291 (-),score=161.41 GHVU01085179.1:355-4227(-)
MLGKPGLGTVIDETGPISLFTRTQDLPRVHGGQGGGNRGKQKAGKRNWRPGGTNGTGKCGRCGRNRHENRADCPATNAECNKCHRKGHFANCCRTRAENAAGVGETTQWLQVLEDGEEVAWLNSSHAEPSGGDPAELRGYTDSCCTASLMSRDKAKGAIVTEKPQVTTYHQTRRGQTLQANAVAVVALKARDTLGTERRFHHVFNLVDEDAPTLFSTDVLYLGNGTKADKSWVKLKADTGAVITFPVTRPRRLGSFGLPFMKYSLAAVKAREYDEGDQAALVSRATPDLKSMHRRLLDPCPKRLQATLAEQGVKITTAEAEGASKDCETCQLKNATNKSVPRSASRHQEPSEFGANVAWDLGHIGERGFNGEHFFSLLVESGTLWWDVKALKRKSEAPDHLTKWIATNGAPKHLLSDNGGELVGVRVRLICRDSHVYLSTVPPYQSKVNGVAERAMREVRQLLRVAFHRLKLPTSAWPALLLGIGEVHNKSASLVDKDAASPYKRRFGVAPDLTFVLGDKVALKPPQSKTAAKTLDLPGKRLTYVARLDDHNVLLYGQEGKKVTLIRAHPSALTKGCLIQPDKDAHGPCLDQPRLWGDSDSEESAAGDRPPPAARSENRLSAAAQPVPPFREGTIFNRNDFDAEWQSQQQPRVDTGRSSESTTRSAEARANQAGQYAVARIPNMREEQFGIVQLLGGTGGRSTRVAWQELESDNTIKPGALATVPTRLIKDRIDLDESGAVAQAVRERIKPDEASAVDADALFLSRKKGLPSTTAPTPGEFELARLREMTSLLRFGAFGSKTHRDRNSMTLNWLLSTKAGSNNEAVAKARLVCRGFLNRVPAETYIGTPSLPFLLLFFIYALCRNWQLGFLDICNAFLQVGLKGGEGEAPTVVLSRLPDLPETCPFPDIPKDEYERLKGAREQLREGETRKIGAAWYGERSSPRLFGFEFKDTMRDSGFEEIEESVSLRKNHAKPDAITVNHVDDVVGAAADVKRDVFETIEKRFKCKDATILKEGGTHTYLGVQYSLKEGAVHVSTQQYVKQLVESNPTEFLMREKGPPLREMERASVSETSPALQREYHEALGVLGWAIRLTPDQHVFHSEFGAHSACPSVRHLHALKSTLLALHSHPPAPVCLKAFEGKPMLYAFCDAAYNRVEMQCRTGYKIYVGGSVLPDIDENVIAWGTKRHKPRVASSTSAELLSLLILVKVLWRYVYVIEKMWGARPGVLVHIDSQALSQQLEKKGVSQEEPRLNPQLKYVAENMVALNGDVILVPRAQQRADALTKMTKWW